MENTDYTPAQDIGTDINNGESASNIQGGDWRANLAPELQTIAAKFNSPEAMIKGYAGLQSLIGRKVSDYSKEDWQTYAAMMQDTTNIPANIDGYELQEAPDGNVLEQEHLDAIKEQAYQLGLNQEQAQALYERENAEYAEHLENATHQCVDCFQQLGDMWGNAYETKLNALTNCVENILPHLAGCSAEEFKEAIGDAYMNPMLMNLFATIGEMCQDSGSVGYNNFTPTDASIRLEQMKSDPDIMKILTNQSDPRHAATKEEFRNLIAMKHKGR